MTTTCCRDGCGRPVGRNGVACHPCYMEHIKDRRPYLHTSLMACRDEFTRAFYLRCVAAYVRGEDVPD